MRMPFTVYHAKPERFRELTLIAYGVSWETHTVPEGAVTLDGNYDKVATVHVEALGEVFQLTNHIDANWTSGAHVATLFAPAERTRSTSVGDIVKDETSGAWFMCLPMGWSEAFKPVDAA